MISKGIYFFYFWPQSSNIILDGVVLRSEHMQSWLITNRRDIENTTVKCGVPSGSRLCAHRGLELYHCDERVARKKRLHPEGTRAPHHVSYEGEGIRYAPRRVRTHNYGRERAEVPISIRSAEMRWVFAGRRVARQPKAAKNSSTISQQRSSH
jgi:hypothetical protein